MKFSWLPFFSELFDVIVRRYDEKTLAEIALKIFEGTGGLVDEYSKGNRGPLKELEPFSFIALFNRGGDNKKSYDKRILWCERAKQLLSLNSQVPTDFMGIPVFQYQGTMFFPFTYERIGSEMQTLWNLAKELHQGLVSSESFQKALSVKCCGPSKLTQSFFIVRPEKFFPLDKNSKSALLKNGFKESELYFDKTTLTLKEYQNLVENIKKRISGKTFYQISYDAWSEAEENSSEAKTPINYWWMNCNPEMWDPRLWEVGQKQTYTTHNEKGNKRRVYQYFTELKPGDIIVGYVTSPEQVVATLHEVTRSIFTDETGKEIIEFKKIKNLIPISSEELRKVKEFQNAEHLKNNQGSLFSLTKEEYQVIESFQNLSVNRSQISENNSSNQSWMISAGENAKMWDSWKKESIISIGWDQIGDASKFKTSEELKTHYVDVFNPEKVPVMTVKAIFEFTHKIKIGDLVYAKQGRSRWFGYGRVVSDYIFDEARPIHKHYRKVEWIKTGEWQMNSDGYVTIKTLTNLSQYPDFVLRINALIDGKTLSKTSSRPYDINEALKELFIAKEEFVQMLDGLSFKKNIILQGPPGVGKTFAAKRLAYSLVGSSDDTRIEFVQFHPSYSYEDFVQGIRPVDGGGFQVQDGLFLQFCESARTSDKPFVVIIDEINRGNLSKIFGELLMLIESDKRSECAHLTYSQDGERFSVPENLYIIGTMNTADRSLSLIDYALRRRFLFYTLKPEIMSKKFEEHLASIGVDKTGINIIQEKISRINEIIAQDTKNLGAGFEIGHSYFSNKPNNISFDQWFTNIMKFEIEPLLKEYWYDNPDKVSEASKLLKAA